jgi:serine/threonine protein kinase
MRRADAEAMRARYPHTREESSSRDFFFERFVDGVATFAAAGAERRIFATVAADEEVRLGSGGLMNVAHGSEAWILGDHRETVGRPKLRAAPTRAPVTLRSLARIALDPTRGVWGILRAGSFYALSVKRILLSIAVASWCGRCNSVRRSPPSTSAVRMSLALAPSVATANARPVIDLGAGRSLIIGTQLGQGTMSEVFRAIVEMPYGIRRAVALKRFGTIASEEVDAVITTLANTIQRSACVRHPNVAQVIELGVSDRQPFVVSELIEGVSLDQLMESITKRGARIALDGALFIATEIAEGVNAARLARDENGAQLGMAHLDLSAREVMLSWNGEVKVTDFEMIAARHAASSIRSVRTMARRALTMSPEVARGRRGDARSDVFALGMMLREILIGRRFPRDSSESDILDYAREGYVHTTCFEPHLPPGFRSVIDRAIQVDPSNRFPHAGAMAYELRRVALSLGVADGRVSLQMMLRNELAAERSEATIEHHPASRTVATASNRPNAFDHDRWKGQDPSFIDDDDED